ncbi:MAG TPA: hypothetical protein VJ326_05275 [Thermoplasmata archaeon]|nr:hypothetical protein [Thermoplasmata archaeon]
MPRGAVALIVLILTACSLSVPGSARADAPALRVGDSWTYRTNTSFAEGFVLNGTARFTLAARGNVSVEGTDHDAFRVEIRGEGAIHGEVPVNGGSVPISGTWDLVGEELLTASGLKVVSSLLELLAQGVTQPFSQPFVLRVRNLTRFTILDDSWRFPVDVGDAGSVRSRFNASEDVSFRYSLFDDTSNSNGTGERTLAYRVESRSDVQTPAGRFEAYAIRETWPDGRYDVLHFAAAVGNNARTQSYNETGAQVATTELVAYRYQALEPATFLGLTATGWAIGLIVASVTTAAASWAWRRRRMALRPPPTPPTA